MRSWHFLQDGNSIFQPAFLSSSFTSGGMETQREYGIWPRPEWNLVVKKEIEPRSLANDLTTILPLLSTPLQCLSMSISPSPVKSCCGHGEHSFFIPSSAHFTRAASLQSPSYPMPSAGCLVKVPGIMQCCGNAKILNWWVLKYN